MKRGMLIALAALMLGGCANTETASTATTAVRPVASKAHAEGAFRRAVTQVAEGGAIRVGRVGTIETSCEPDGVRWGCTGWFVVESREYCVTVGANVGIHVGKETYGKIPIGKPGGFECEP